MGLNRWGLSGKWTVERERIVLSQPSGRIGYQFHARDVNLVMGPIEVGRSVRFRVLIDGQPPGSASGSDVDERGFGIATYQRMYQLVRQRSDIRGRRFEIEFLDADVAAYAFTFG